MGDAGRILSREEVDAVLAAVGSAPPAPALDPFHPPCLRAADLVHVETLRRELAPALAEALGRVLGSSRVRAVETPGALWPETGRAAGDDHAVALDPEFAFPALERLLGGRASEAHLPGRAPGDTEWRLLQPVLAALAAALDRVLPAATPTAAARPRTDPVLLGLPWAYELDLDGRPGGFRIFLPERRIAAELERRGWRDTPAPSGPVALRLPVLELDLARVGALKAGELLATPLPAGSGWILDGGPGRRLGARPGELDGRVAAELAGPAGPEPGGRLEVPGSAEPPPGFPVDLAVVAATLRIPAELQPGRDLALDPPGPLLLAAGPRVLAEGSLDRRGDRLALRIDRVLPRS